MAGLINLGAGLSEMGKSISDFGAQGMKNEYDTQKLLLANQLEGGREMALENLRQKGELANTTAQGEQSRLTAQSTIPLQGEQARQTSQFENELPETEFQKSQAQSTRMQAEAAVAEANKPISGGFTGTFLVRDPKSGEWKVQNGAGSTAPITIDKDSNNLSAQTGLSSQAISLMTGQTKGQRMTAAQSKQLSDEITKWGVANNVNTSTMAPQATAAFNVLTQNIQRNNQAGILENEISGSVDNAAQIANDISQGRIKMVNVANVWAGKQINDPKTIQAADQLGRLRNELAGYNAVAGGHLMQNGTPEPTPQDFREAETTISNGINSGGLKALSQSVAMSAAKNRNVLEGAIDKANSDYFKLFGANYHAPNRAAQAASGNQGTGSPGKTVVRTGTENGTGRRVIQYSDGTSEYAP